MRLAQLAFAAAASGVVGDAAHADGFFDQQSYGVSRARGRDQDVIGESLQLRIGLGWRWGAVSVGPTFYGHLAVDRQDSFLKLVGGHLQDGDSDMEVAGLDLKYNAPLDRNISVYRLWRRLVLPTENAERPPRRAPEREC